MIRQTDRAFTLIELLIVVAIMAIFAASMLAVITGPMFEQPRSVAESTQQAGASLFLARIVDEVHSAQRIQSGTNAVAFTGGGRNGGDVVYALDSARQLHRIETPTSGTMALLQGVADKKTIEVAPMIIAGVEKLTAEPMADQPGIVRVSLECMLQVNRNPIALKQHVDLGVGSFWVGGGAR